MLWQRKNSFYRLMPAMFLIVVSLIIVNAQPKRGAALNQESTEQMPNSVTQALQNEDFVKAANLLKRIVLKDPKNVTAHTLTAIVADKTNNLNLAEKHFALAAKISPKSAETRNNYGAILLRLKRPAEAAKEFSASLAINPNQPSALVNLSQIRFAENTNEGLTEARILLNKAKQISRDAEIPRALVLINLRLNDIAEAKANYWEYASSAQNFSAATQIELGDALAEKGLFKETLQELNTVVKTEPTNVSALVSLARAYLRQKDVKSAGRLLESAAAGGITDARVYAALAEVYEAGGYFENAVPAMRLAIEKDARNEQYRFRYGMLLIETKAPPAAVIRLKEAVNEFPNSARIRLGLGIAQYHDGKLTDAEKTLKQALELDANSVFAYAYLAFIKNVVGLAGEAALYLERAIAIDEKNAVLHYLLADNLQKIATSDSRIIEKHLRRAIELDSEIGGAYLALGRIYIRQRRFEEAASSLEKTIQLEPNRTEAYYQLAQVYGRLKRADESRTILAKFKELSEKDKNQTKTEYVELLRRMANVKF